MTVLQCDYPVKVSWENKANAMPSVPRGNQGMIGSLYEILALVDKHASPNQKVDIEGSNSATTLNDICVKLRPLRLVVKTSFGWSLTEEAKKWVETKDNTYLAALFSANIRFFAEMLVYLDSPKTAKELQRIAADDFQLNWKTKSDINARLVWLREFGFVEFRAHALEYLATERGRAFLKIVEIEKPVKVEYNVDDTIKEELDLPDWALAVANNISERKPSIGYIPGNMKEFDKTILSFLQIIEQKASIEEIMAFGKREYDIADSSVRSFMTTLSNMGLVERKTDVLYGITEKAISWLEKTSAIELLCLLHGKFKFMFEMLHVLEQTSLNYKELAATAKVNYGFERESVEEIRKRVSFFKATNLLRNASVDTFTITNKGKRLLDRVTIEKTMQQVMIDEPQVSQEEQPDLITELHLAAKDNNNPDRLERAVHKAFEALGFESKWLGGSGKTDVLVRAKGAYGDSFVVTVDAKSTSSGSVTDGLVDFDTIIEHREKHFSNYAAIVGGKFQNERLIKRAKEHNVVLIDIDSLERLLRNHLETPLPAVGYRSLFEKPGIVDISLVIEKQKEQSHQGNLIMAVVSCLVEEADNPDTQGMLFSRDVYFSLRKDKQFETAPTIDEISAVLDFLASPLIGCVSKKKDAYFATGTVADVAQIFRYYARLCSRET